MAELAYSLCALTSLLCAAMLLRGYSRSGMRLLLWSGLCFVGLTLNNFVLFLDKVIYPTHDLTLWRDLTGFLAMVLLVYGLIWESE